MFTINKVGRINRDDDTLKQVRIFALLMISIFICFFIVSAILEGYKERKIYSNIYDSDNEFVRTIDCAPIIDKQGVLKEYEISFEIKAEKEGPVFVLFENGNGSKYSFLEMVYATTNYEKHVLKISPILANDDYIESYLAFYGEYGTGVNPTVRYLEFKVCN